MLLARPSSRRCWSAASGHLVFVASLSGKAPSPHSSIYNATKFGLRGFALGLRADLAPQRHRRLARLARVHPRGGDVRRVGRQPPAGPRHGDPGAGRARPVKAIEGDKVEVAVAPLLQRFLAHFGLRQPGDRGPDGQSGSAGQKAAAEVAAGHSKDKR